MATIYQIACDSSGSRLGSRRDLYAVGYDGNWFATEEQAESAIGDLRACGFEDADLYVVETDTSTLTVRDWMCIRTCGLTLTSEQAAEAP